MPDFQKARVQMIHVNQKLRLQIALGSVCCK